MANRACVDANMYESNYWIADAIPGAKQAMIPDAGHISNLENPPAFNVVLMEILTGL